MTPDEVRAFVCRDWEAVAASKIAYWADRFRQDGWLPAWRAADALLLDVRQSMPTYPDEGQRTQDYSTHVRVRRQLDSAADAFACR